MPGPIDTRIGKPVVAPTTTSTPATTPAAQTPVPPPPPKKPDTFTTTNTTKGPVTLETPAQSGPPSALGAPRARTVNGATLETARAAYPELARFAGTPLNDPLQQGIAKGQVRDVPKDVVVEGPSVFSPEARQKQPSGLGSLINKVCVWSSFQMATDRADRLRLGGDPTHLKLPAVSSKEMLALTRELGPDGKPKLMPGDMIACGCNGHTGHMIIYAGNDPKTGEPQIIHSMATADTQQSYLQIAGNALKAAFSSTGKVGVIKEGMAEFFDRFPRDSYVVLRDPRMTDEMRAKGLAHVATLVGKGYDYDLNQDNDAYYCSEMGVELLKAAYQGSGQQLPWVGTTAINEFTLTDQVAAPENFIASPDFQVTTGNASGYKNVEHIVKSYVSGIRAPGTPAPSQADLDKLVDKPQQTDFVGG